MRLRKQIKKVEGFRGLRLLLLYILLPIFSVSAQSISFSEIHQLINNHELETAKKAIEKAKQKKKNQRGLKSANLLHLEGKIQFAKGAYQEAKHTFETVAFQDNIPLKNANYIQLAATYIELQDLEKADSLLNRIKTNTWEWTYQMGLLRVAQHEYKAADSRFEQLLSNEFLANIQLQALYRLGESKLQQEAFLEADSLLNLALQKAQNAPPTAAIYIQNYLGRLKYEIGKHGEAEAHFLAGLDLAKRYFRPKHPYRGKLLYGLGNVYLETGKFQEAEENFQVAQEIYLETYGESLPYANLLSGFEDLYDKLGQHQRALEYALQQKAIYLQSGSLQDFARIANNLSYSYQDLGELEKADVLLMDAISQLEAAELTEDRYYALLHMNYAILKLDQKSYYQSKQSFEIAQQQIDKIYGKMHPWYATVINYLAVLYEKLEEYDKAEKLYLETEEIDRKTLGKKHPYYVNTLYNISKFYRLRSQNVLAIKYFQAANEGQVNLIYNYYSGFDELTRLDYLKETEADFERFYSFALEHSDLATEVQNISLVIKNLALDFSRDQQASASILQDSITANIYKEWRETKKILANSYIKSEGELIEAAINIKTLEQESERLEKTLIRTKVLDAQKLNASKKYTFAELKSKIAPDEAVIDFLRFQYHAPERKTDSIYYAALISRQDSEQPKFIFLAEEKALRRMLRSDVRRNTNNYIENPRISQDLYQTIWQPLTEYIKDAKNIHIAADGLLHKVAFAALPTENGLLLNEHNFIYHGNLRAFIESKSEKEKQLGEQSICLLGGADFDLDFTQMTKEKLLETKSNTIINSPVFEDSISANDSLRSAVIFNYLSGTTKEIHKIEKQFQIKKWQTNMLEGEQALEKNIKQLEGENAPNILHLATHGYFFPPLKKGRKVPDNGRGRIMSAKNPLLRSGLALSGANYLWKQGKNIDGVEDGILTAYEIANLNLSKTQLAVLSACETALGDVRTSEGVFGLQRAFKMAGVEQLIISLWKVPDQQTTELMQLFYENYLKTNDAALALYEAQQSMSETYSPFYWAAFVLLK